MPWDDIARRDYARRVAALCKRSDGSGMGADRALPAFAAAGRPSPDDGPAGGGERDPLHGGDRLPVAHAAEGPAAVLDGAALLLRLARQRAVADDQQPSGHGGARTGGSGGEPDGGHHRQPERENHRERRGLRLRCWQEGQGAQAAHRHRHARADGRPGGPCGRRPGPRRRAEVLQSIRTRWPWLRHVFADGGYAGPKLEAPCAASATGRSRSSSAPTRPRASRCCRADGWSSAPSHGSDAAAAWPRTGRNPSHPPRHGSSSPTSAS